MKNRADELTWSEVALFGAGSLAGALLGVLALSRLLAAMAAQAPGFWYVSRAAAIVGYLLLWGSTAWGVLLSLRGAAGLVTKPLAYAAHNITSWLGIGFAALHALALLGDRVVPFTAAGLLVPFAADYKPALTGLGTLSLYLALVVSVTFYLQKRIGRRAWRTIHYLSFLVFVGVTIHGIALGTDSNTRLMQAMYVLAGSSVLFLTLYRILTAGAGRRPAQLRRPQAMVVKVEG